MKQTAVEWLFNNLNISGGSDDMKAFEQAKAMEKEHIIEAVESTIKSVELTEDKKAFFAMGGEGYYNETFTKDVRYYIIDCGEDIRNTILFDITDKLKKQGHYFIVNATPDSNQFDVKRVTKQQFDESKTNL